MKNFKNIVASLSIGIISLSGVASLNAQNEDPGEKLDLYLLIGQSNMAGRAPFTEAEAEPLKRCYLLNQEDKWEFAKNPLNRHSTIRKGLGMQKLNPGYSFAKKMIKESRRASIGLIVNAKGGTSIEQWKKGSQFYEEAIRRAKIAEKNGNLKGILWHQGEGNKGNPEVYLEQLTQLVKDLREDLGNPKLPFVAGQVNNLPKINEAIAGLPEALPYTAFASSEGLTAYDRWHFDAKSVKLLGERYAEEMIKLLKD